MSSGCTCIGFTNVHDGDRRTFPPAVTRALSPVRDRDERQGLRPNGAERTSRARSRSLVEQMAAAVAHGATSLFGLAGTAGRLDRQRFWSAVLVAAGLIVTAYAMDWFLFGTVRLAWPDFFPIVAGGALALRLPILSVRRLRDAGRSGWLTLALLVPVAGWLLLVRWWCTPSADAAAFAPAHPGASPPRSYPAKKLTPAQSPYRVFHVRASASRAKD